MKPPIEFKVMRIRECVSPAHLIDTPEQAMAYWRANIPNSPWYDEAKECLVVLILNTRKRIMGHNLVSLGGLDTCFVHAREVFRPVIVAAGSAIVLMHNHPSGDSTPSDADIRVTRELIRAGQLMRIELLDHVIVGERHVSLKELGYFYA
jgi:DNA repair protein RadC